MSPRFRRNHDRPSSSGMGRVGIFAILLVFGMWYLFKAIGQLEIPSNLEESSTSFYFGAFMDMDDCEFIDHEVFALCYSEDHEQPHWTAHLLTSEDLNEPRVERYDYFSEDPLVDTKSAHHRDYTRSGYTRGHLVPAADMGHDLDAMKKTFFMSNICPQLKAFNGGIWRELEELCRDWAHKHQTLYIVTGPLFSKDAIKTIGKTSQVRVPDYFYKAIMNEDYEAVGFLFPHQMSSLPIWDFSVTIDSLENVLNSDLFHGLLPDDVEDEVESKINENLWPIDQRRFEKRVTDWNNR